MLDQDHCGICKKLTVAPQPVTPEVRKSIVDVPQCEACGCTYLYLTGKICGSCNKAASTGDNDGLIAFVSARVKDFSNEASKHRLNQVQGRAQSLQLQSAAQVNMKAAEMRKANKSEVVTVSAGLWMILHTSSTAKKLLPLNTSTTFQVGYNADDMLNDLASKAKGSYDMSPTTIRNINTRFCPSFERKSISFGILKTTSNITEFDQHELLDTTVGELFSNLKTNNLLSQKDIKDRSLSMRILVYEPAPESDADDEDDVKSKTPPPPPPRTRKRKLTDGKSSASPAPSARRYESAYRPQPLVLRSTSPPLQYDSHIFRKTAFVVNKVGEGMRVESKHLETILVARDWQLHRRSSVPFGGYIAKGFSKFAFRAQIGTTAYAIVQSKPIMSSEDMNNSDLIDELALLHLGQYFMETFYARALFYKVKALPRMSWNMQGSFIGTLETPPPQAPDNYDDDKRSLVFSTFLATAILPYGPSFKEIKFSGNTEQRHCAFC